MALPGEPILPLPTAPDFLLCSSIYAEQLSTLDCLQAAKNGIPNGTAAVAWATNPSLRTDYRLPLQTSHGDCSVRIQVAGPFTSATNTPNIWAIPNDIRSLAAKVIQRCVTLSGGLGGFGTHGISSLLSYVANGWTPSDFWGLDDNSQRNLLSVPFLTVTLSRIHDRDKDPGNTDPVIPFAMSNAARYVQPRRTQLHPFYQWAIQAESMMRGGPRTWYSWRVPMTREMSYECDSTLGAPSSHDCSQILLTSLGSSSSSSDTLTVTPGTTTFLHSNTCYVAISTAVSLVLTWAQIATAVSTLMNVCVQQTLFASSTQNPASKGGRAFYSPPQQIIASNDRRRRKRQNDDANSNDLLAAEIDHTTNLTGLNALPPSVNITLFEQTEAWVNEGAEIGFCTWKAVERHGDVQACW
ncbi:hypothetical protein MMC14_007266 [Varicellaria rhodocarpa]|nr:hypothetical protein [Varicellaria rhodocarpa]